MKIRLILAMIISCTGCGQFAAESGSQASTLETSVRDVANEVPPSASPVSSDPVPSILSTFFVTFMSVGTQSTFLVKSGDIVHLRAGPAAYSVGTSVITDSPTVQIMVNGTLAAEALSISMTNIVSNAVVATGQCVASSEGNICSLSTSSGFFSLRQCNGGGLIGGAIAPSPGAYKVSVVYSDTSSKSGILNLADPCVLPKPIVVSASLAERGIASVEEPKSNPTSNWAVLGVLSALAMGLGVYFGAQLKRH